MNQRKAFTPFRVNRLRIPLTVVLYMLLMATLLPASVSAGVMEETPSESGRGTMLRQSNEGDTIYLPFLVHNEAGTIIPNDSDFPPSLPVDTSLVSPDGLQPPSIDNSPSQPQKFYVDTLPDEPYTQTQLAVQAANVVGLCTHQGGDIPCLQGMPFTVTVSLPPGVVTSISPIGDTPTTTPIFTWNVESVADDYEIAIYEEATATYIHFATYSASTVCSGATCSLTPSGLVLNLGNHRWWIRASNTGGNGPWGYSKLFTVTNNTPPPGIVTSISPVGDTPTTTPIFTWDVESTADNYEIAIYEEATATYVHFVTYSANAVCSGATCSLTPSGLVLNLGDHRWWVRASNSGGNGPWNVSKSFTVTDNTTPPGVVTSIAPVGDMQNTSPAFTWEVESNATHYELAIREVATSNYVHFVTYDASVVCSGTTCSVTPSGLVLNLVDHRWWVRASNSGGSGPWNVSKLFTVIP